MPAAPATASVTAWFLLARHGLHQPQEGARGRAGPARLAGAAAGQDGRGLGGEEFFSARPGARPRVAVAALPRVMM